MKTLVNIVVAAIAATTPLFSVAQSEPSGRILYGYSGEISRGLGSATPGSIESGAIEIPQDIAEKWEGNYVTQIIVGFGTSSESEITVFISDSLDTDPIYTQDAKIQNQLGWNIVELDTPYEITGSSFFVGYSSFVGQSNDKPIGIDDIKNDNPYSSWIEIDGEWSNYAKFFGNVCLQILIEGDRLPQNEVVLNSVEAPELIEKGTPFSVTLDITNLGVAPVAEVSPQYTINGVTSAVSLVSLPEGEIPSQQSGKIILSGLICEETGLGLPVQISLGLINGEENESQTATSVIVNIDCAEKCYPQNMVTEEFTGTWCGWCPEGIEGMKFMEENYGDKGFIGIAIHYGDEMTVESYSPLAAIYYSSPGFPCALANRGELIEPSAESLLDQYKKVTTRFSPATIEVMAVYNEEENTLKATATSEFSFDQKESSYKVAFVIIENNIGPYAQENYFTNGELGQTLEGWTDKPYYVNTIYNEVAMDITDLYGIDGSVPAEVISGKQYTYTTELPLNNVEDIGNCRVIAFLIDSVSGKIVNGAKTAIEGASGVGAMNVDAGGVFKVFNVQGMKILETENTSDLNSLPRGIYIVNGKKVIIK